MRRRKLLLFTLIGAVLILSLAAAGWVLSGQAAASTVQGGTDAEEDDREGADVPITGDALEDAKAAALEYLGDGRVTGTEVGDEEGYYEIEVVLDGGGRVDVHLDKEFNVLGQEGDGHGRDD